MVLAACKKADFTLLKESSTIKASNLVPFVNTEHIPNANVL